MSDVNKMFAGRLRAIMREMGDRVAALSNKTGIAPSSISNYRMGTRECGIQNLAILSETLSVSPAYLIGLEGEEEASQNMSVDPRIASAEALWNSIPISPLFPDLLAACEKYQKDHTEAVEQKAKLSAAICYDDDNRVSEERLSEILSGVDRYGVKKSKVKQEEDLREIAGLVTRILETAAKVSDSELYDRKLREYRDDIEATIQAECVAG